MTRYGYFLTSEESEPASPIEQAKLAEIDHPDRRAGMGSNPLAGRLSMSSGPG
jgi:hypothetical protein